MTSNALDSATVLSHSLLFRGIPLPDLGHLIAAGKVVTTEPGGILIEEEGKVPGLHVILDGDVHIVKSGQAQVTQLGRGNFFGEISLFGLVLGATASVTAPRGCTVFVITEAQLRAWFKSHPAHELTFFKHLASELCSRLNSTTAKLAKS
jgi:CRP-like cAMP-binding protein